MSYGTPVVQNLTGKSVCQYCSSYLVKMEIYSQVPLLVSHEI